MHVMALHHKYLYDPVALSTTSAVLLRFAGDVLSHSHVHDNKWLVSGYLCEGQ